MLTWRGASKLCTADAVGVGNRRDVWRQKELLLISKEWSETLGGVLPAAKTKASLCAFLAELGVLQNSASGATKNGAERETRPERKTQVSKSAPKERRTQVSKSVPKERKTKESDVGSMLHKPRASSELASEGKSHRDVRAERKDAVYTLDKISATVAALVQIIVEPRDHASARAIVVRYGLGARQERGHIRTNVHQLRAGSLYVFSKWASRAAMDAYLSKLLSPASLKTTMLDRYLVAPPTVSRAKMLSQPDPNPPAGTPHVTLVPFFSVVPDKGHVKRVADAHLSVVDSTRREPGCLEYELYQLLDNPQLLFFYESWQSPEALAKHMNTSTFYRVVRNKVDPLLLVPWTALSMEPVHN